jgi:hypothetical protein
MSGPIILVGLRGVDQARENGWIKLVRSDKTGSWPKNMARPPSGSSKC